MSNRAFIRSYQTFPENGDEHHMCVSMDSLRQMDKRAGYQQGYEHAEQETIARGLQWLVDHINDYQCDKDGKYPYSALFEDFQTAMKQDVHEAYEQGI